MENLRHPSESDSESNANESKNEAPNYSNESFEGGDGEEPKLTSEESNQRTTTDDLNESKFN